MKVETPEHFFNAEERMLGENKVEDAAQGTKSWTHSPSRLEDTDTTLQNWPHQSGEGGVKVGFSGDQKGCSVLLRAEARFQAEERLA